MSASRSCCCNGMSNSKLVFLLCVVGLLANFLVFTNFKSFNPRVILGYDQTVATTPAIPTEANPGHIETPQTNPAAAAKGDAGGGDANSKINEMNGKDILVYGKDTDAPKSTEGKPADTAKDVVNPQDVEKEEPKPPADKPSGDGASAKAGEAVGEALPSCPEKPPELVGRFATDLHPVSLATVEQKYPEVTFGGHYRPKDCKAQQKLAIVIPCRNREEHLHILLNNVIRMLMRQKLDFSIFVIDQDMPTTFNRGMLFNVGFMEALKKGTFDCFIFHDVDMIPTNDNCLYKCANHPRHFLGGLSKWKYGLPYGAYYGGVVSFSKEQYEKINGGSNLYFGWGGEDDDLRARVLGKGYSMVRYPKEIGRYDTVNHKRDSGNADNPVRFNLVKTATQRQDEEGLRTTKYKVTEVVETKLFTKIKVFINMTETLMTRPSMLKDPDMLKLLEEAKSFDKQVKVKA